MVTFNIAYTARINSPDDGPKLTQSQVWEGLKLKVRRAQDFVSAITECKVIAEDTLPTGDLQVTREVQFASGTAQAGNTVKEVCVHYEPCRVVFNQEDGSTVTNIISKNSNDELFMSYVFEWRHPDIDPKSDRAKELELQHWKMAKMAVHSSIDTIRRMVTDGKIK